MPDKQYNVDGTLYQIPDSETESFVKDFPKAQEVKVFVHDKDTLGIPVNEVDNFLKDVPQAKPLSEPKSESSVTPQGEITPTVSDEGGVKPKAETDLGQGKPRELGALADILSSPAKAAYEGISGGIEELGKAAKTFKDSPTAFGMTTPASAQADITALLQGTEAIAKGVFGAMNVVVPAVAGFTIAQNTAENLIQQVPEGAKIPFGGTMMVEPKDILQAVTAPMTTAMQNYFPKELQNSPLLQSVSGLTDMALPIILGGLTMKGKGKLAEQIKKGEPMEADKVKEAVDAVNSFTPQEIQKSAAQVVVDHLSPDIAHLKDKEIKLQQDANNAVPVMGDAGLNLFKPSIDKAAAQFDEQANNLTEKAKIERALPLMESDEGKQLLEQQGKAVQERIDKLRPTPKAEDLGESNTTTDATLSKPTTGEMGAHPDGNESVGGKEESSGVGQSQQGSKTPEASQEEVTSAEAKPEAAKETEGNQTTITNGKVKNESPEKGQEKVKEKGGEEQKANPPTSEKSADYTPTEKAAAEAQAKAEGYTSLKHKIADVNKYLSDNGREGEKAERLQELPAEAVKAVVEKRQSDDSQNPIIKKYAKSLADMQIKDARGYDKESGRTRAESEYTAAQQKAIEQNTAALEKLQSAIDNKDYKALSDKLHLGNKTWRSFFEESTGVKLGKTLKETTESLKKFTDYKEPPKVEVAPKEKKSIADVRAEKALDLVSNYEGEGKMSRRQFIDKKVSEGATVSEHQVKAAGVEKKMQEEYDYLRREAPIGNSQHPQTKRMYELKKMLAEGVTKTTYGLTEKSGGTWSITKTEYDYAKSLHDVKELSKDNEQKSVPPIKSAWESNLEALTHPETGLAAVTRKIFEEQQPAKDAFLKRIGLSREDYEKLDSDGKQKVQDRWVKSDEFKSLEKGGTDIATDKWSLEKSKRLKALQDKEDAFKVDESGKPLTESEQKEFDALGGHFDKVKDSELTKADEKALGWLYDVPREGHKTENAKPSLSEIKSKVIEKADESKASAKKEGVSLKVQKNDLLSQINRARLAVKELVEGAKDSEGKTATLQADLENALKKEGFDVVNNGTRKNYGKEQNDITQVVFDVEGDGTFKLAADGLDIAYDEVKKHWTTDPNAKPKIQGLGNNRLPLFSNIEYAETVEDAERILEEAKSNLATANKSGDEKLINFYASEVGEAKKQLERRTADESAPQEEVVEKEETADAAKKVSNTPTSEDYYTSVYGSEFKKVKGKEVPNPHGLDLFVHKDKKSFDVSEGRTGVKMATGATEAEAIKNANELIEKHGIERTKELIAKKESESGTSPRYEVKAESTKVAVTPLESKIDQANSLKEKARAKAAKGIDGIIEKIGGKKNLLPEEKTKLFDDIKNIVEGLATEAAISLKEAAAHVIEKIKNTDWYKRATAEDKIHYDEIIEKVEGLGKEETGETTGISHESQIERAEELGAEAPERGQGITAEEAIQKGRDLISQGADADQVAAEFKKDGKISADALSVVRARHEELVRASNRAIDNFGENSQHAKEALAKENEWYNNVVKPMQTEWHKVGMVQQGEVEIDTGTFVGLRRAFQQETGKDFTPEQAKKAKELSQQVKSLTDEVDRLKNALTEAINKAVTEAEKSPKNIKAKATQLATLIRKGKLSRPDVFSAATPASIIWDGAIEIAAKTVEAGGTIAQAITDGIKHIQDSDWYGSLAAIKRAQADKAFTDFIKQSETPDILTQFIDKKDLKFTPEEVKAIWKYAKENYTDNGRPYDEMVNGVSTDLGLTPQQVRTAIALPKGAKIISDEMYRAQYRRNYAVGRAKQWVKTANTPRLTKILKAVPAFFFEKAILGHGTVGMITHAGINIFNPAIARSYWTNFGRQFKYLTKPAEFEKAKEYLQSKPNYILAKRAGLANDPTSIYDDYSAFKKFFGKFGTAGDRGFFALKMFRQEMFDHYYDNLSEAERADPNSVKEIASIVNHATGTSKVPVPETVGTAIFAPRLEASRWARLVGEPTKAITTITNWKEATPSEKAAAKIIAKRAGAIFATYMAGLAVNQGILSATGSTQKINVLHPLDKDWLKFKFGDKTVDVSGGMVSTLGFIANMIALPFLDRKELKGDTQAGKAYENIGKYGRGKLSPFGSFGFDVMTQHDYAGNTLPFSHAKPAHSYNHKMTWKEYLWTQAPIPASEGARDVYMEMEKKKIPQPKIEDVFSGIFIGIISGGTGTRIGVAPKKH